MWTFEDKNLLKVLSELCLNKNRIQWLQSLDFFFEKEEKSI